MVPDGREGAFLIVLVLKQSLDCLDRAQVLVVNGCGFWVDEPCLLPLVLEARLELLPLVLEPRVKLLPLVLEPRVELFLLVLEPRSADEDVRGLTRRTVNTPNPAMQFNRGVL